MKIYLVAAMCFITQIIFASYAPHSLKDSSLFNLKKRLLFINDEKVLPFGIINNSSIKNPLLKRKKLSFRNTINNFLFIHKLKKSGTNNKSDFNFWGLLLGVALGPLGVLVAYISSKKKNLRKWSVVGCVTDIGLGIVFLITIILVIGAF